MRAVKLSTTVAKFGLPPASFFFEKSPGAPHNSRRIGSIKSLNIITE